MVRPSIPRGFSLKSVRNGDTLSVYVPEFNDSGTGHWSFSELPAFGGEGGASTATANNSGLDTVPDTATAVLYRNGKQIAASNNSAWGNSEVPPGKATYNWT
ncbi:hypothetical protein OG894_01325 [Streptomyces sp. NBC_01724]|uniref:hypothetical protein n=2 Tax=Streptomyces TaxID=1883 RepID=UPI002E3316D9|nr:hypothetical protein [Streptomyces sp. NBC_01724]WTE56548.1 hypothetical protein OG987_41335 [Streptomyces sp. NBC_01620]WTE64619.1 hypothetical protein OG784_41065 [Streptomyces sp. NBC_01617]WTI91907.1 hypothetical protein OHB17_40375 [Streptomyces sp. NBC_00724]